MNQKPELNPKMDASILKEYYYLKEELVHFCRKYQLQTSGSKIDLMSRIYEFLSTGKKTTKNYHNKKTTIEKITLDTLIEENFICSEKHRAFYKDQIGECFSFNVPFQKWLKSHYGKTYRDSIQAYYEILEEKKKTKTTIDPQFEYNTYIRDFFVKNSGKTLKQAICCWNYKKKLKGHNKYEVDDLEALKQPQEYYDEK